MPDATVADLLAALREQPAIRDTWLAQKEIAARAAAHAAPDACPLAPPVAAALAAAGIPALWTHQAEAVAVLRAGHHVVVSTPTASGKSLVYGIPIAEGVAAAPDAMGALCIYPLKALARDQARALAALGEAVAPGVFRLGVYDGDTPRDERERLRRSPPHVLITTPDMLHHGILPNHPTWERFFRRLRFVVVDEVHTYRGVFGSHVAAILRRLWRVARHHGASPLAVASSATIANPGALLEALVGEGGVTVVDRDGAPRSRRHLVLLNPPVGGSSSTLAARVMRTACGLGLRTIAFTGSRRMTELLYTWIADADPALRPRLSAYRAGYRPEERREIEARLSNGDLLGVITTSALEAGIDIGGLDVCVLLGYPGTVTATFQRAGRVGRGVRESAVVLVAGHDALDQYVIRHADEVFGKGAESAVCDPANPEVLKAHLPCAAAELPLREGEGLVAAARARGALDACTKAGTLLQTAVGDAWLAARRRPHPTVDIREVGRSFTIIDPDEEVLGSVSAGRAFAEAHPGAIYLHRGEVWEITALDIDHALARARPARVPYYTEALAEKETEILEVTRVRPLGNTVLRLGRLKVTTRVTGFQRRHTSSRQVLGGEPLDLPPQTMETEGMWIEVPEPIEAHLTATGRHFMGAIHAGEHATIAVVPLFVLCDPGDVGGISYKLHPGVGHPAIFFYDGYPGGVGLTARAFEVAEALLARARDVIRECPCEAGCPGCIHSPRCGNGNNPLDKRAAVETLDILLGAKSLGELAAAAPVAEAPQSLPVREPAAAREPRVVIFDVETQRSAADVGGWDRAHLMRVAVAVACVLPEGTFHEFREDEVPALLRLLEGADCVVGFNCLKFDYAVLSAYTPLDLRRRLHTLDLLVEVERTLGRRASLASLATATLGSTKSADGLQSLEWWKAGDVAKVLAYCRDDVALTRDLYLHGRRAGHVLLDVKGGERVRVAVDFDPARAAVATR